MVTDVQTRPSVAAIEHDNAASWGVLLARICFAADFILFGCRKFMSPENTIGALESHHLPGWLLYPTIVLQVGGGLLLLVGLQTRIAAIAFAWFCIVAPSIFWTNNLENLSRDYAAAGGFLLLLLYGPGRFSLDASLRSISDPVKSCWPGLFDNERVVERVMLVARVLIAFPFLGDVVKKAIYGSAQQSIYEAAGLGAGTMYVVMILELVFGIAVLIGYRTRVAVLILLALTVLFGLMLRYPGYDLAVFSQDFGQVMIKNFNNRNQASFFKDVTTIGALMMLLVVGPGSLSWDHDRDSGNRLLGRSA